MNPLVLKFIPENDAAKVGALVRCGGQVPPGVSALFAWIQSERERLDAEMRIERDEVTLRRKQGASQALEDVLTELERVSEVQRPWKTQ